MEKATFGIFDFWKKNTDIFPYCELVNSNAGIRDNISYDTSTRTLRIDKNGFQIFVDNTPYNFKSTEDFTFKAPAQGRTYLYLDLDKVSESQTDFIEKDVFRIVETTNYEAPLITSKKLILLTSFYYERIEMNGLFSSALLNPHGLLLY